MVWLNSYIIYNGIVINMLFKDIQVVKLDNQNMYAVGNIDLLQTPCISVAGSRKITPESSEWLDSMVSQCGNHTIVSGLALGADTVAHKSALKHGLPTIAVLPSGVNNIAPRSNIKLAKEIVENDGLLLSAYEPNKAPNRNSYIARNKVIASLGKFLIMPQCDKHSGTMHTVRFTSQYNKFIVLPNNDYSGNQYIIANKDFKVLIR